MPIVYKINVLQELKNRGYPTSRLRKEELLAESVVQHLRTGGGISFSSLGRVCALLQCKPGDILDYVDDQTALLTPKPMIERTEDEEFYYMLTVWDEKYRKPGEPSYAFNPEDYKFLLPIPDDWVSPFPKKKRRR